MTARWSEFLDLGLRIDFDPDQPRDEAGRWSRENSPWPGDAPEAPEGPLRGRGKNKKATYTREQIQRMANEKSRLSIPVAELAKRLELREKKALRAVFAETANFQLGREIGYERNPYGLGDAKQLDELESYGLLSFRTKGLEPGAKGAIVTYAALTDKGMAVLDLVGRE